MKLNTKKLMKNLEQNIDLVHFQKYDLWSPWEDIFTITIYTIK